MDDNSVSNCYNCDTQFNFLNNEKHHCRFCGKIFCSACTNYQTYIPEELLSDNAKKGTWNDYIMSHMFLKDPTKHKVCMTCLKLIESIQAVKKIIEVFFIDKFGY